MYCGHGSGSQYISGDEIERLRVRGVPLLLGCSSGRLERLGRTLDPLGTSLSYLMATAPALLGFLWCFSLPALFARGPVVHHGRVKDECIATRCPFARARVIMAGVGP